LLVLLQVGVDGPAGEATFDEHVRVLRGQFLLALVDGQVDGLVRLSQPAVFLEGHALLDGELPELLARGYDHEAASLGDLPGDRRLAGAGLAA
jgi:hypothetical protein